MSVFPALSKIYEKVVEDQVYHAFAISLSPNLSGNLAGHSCGRRLEVEPRQQEGCWYACNWPEYSLRSCPTSLYLDAGKEKMPDRRLTWVRRLILYATACCWQTSEHKHCENENSLSSMKIHLPRAKGQHFFSSSVSSLVMTVSVNHVVFLLQLLWITLATKYFYRQCLLF